MATHRAATEEREQVLLGIVRNLPPERAEQLVDFARFLEAQLLEEALLEDDDQNDRDDARWDSLLASEEGQALLERLAGEALTEHRAGRTRPLIFNDEGEIEAE